MITGLYAAIFAITQAFMVIWIARSRIKEKVSLGTAKSSTLEIKSRVYGNFTEVVPLGLLLMLIAELGQAPTWTIHLMGVFMLSSRALHAKGLVTPPGYGLYRMTGMIFAMLSYIIGAIICLLLAYPNLTP